MTYGIQMGNERDDDPCAGCVKLQRRVAKLERLIVRYVEIAGNGEDECLRCVNAFEAEAVAIEKRKKGKS